MLHILVLIHLLTWTIYSRATILYELNQVRTRLPEVRSHYVRMGFPQFFYWSLQRCSLQTRRRCPRVQTYTYPRGCSTYLTHIVHDSLMGTFYHHVHCNKKDKAIQHILYSIEYSNQNGNGDSLQVNCVHVTLTQN